MDLKAFAAGEDVAAPGHPEWGFAGLARHFVGKPLIAAVNGPAMGGGAEIVLACDLAVASTKASIGLPEVKRGLFAAGGGVIRLGRQIPRRIAAELIYTGEPIDGARALELGLVNRLVEPEVLLDTALALAQAIALNAPLAVQASKRLMHESFADGSDWSDRIWERNQRVVAQIQTSADGVEGARAFAEKRAPVWTGR
jgi:crotonobetainyl-CoA hydratase